MSATTPGMRQIWTDTVVRCVDQRIANVSSDRGPIAQTSSVVDSAETTSDIAGQNAASSAGEMSDHKTVTHSDAVKPCQPVSDRAEPSVTSLPRLSSSVPASISDSVLHTDSQSTDVCCVLLGSHILPLVIIYYALTLFQ